MKSQHARGARRGIFLIDLMAGLTIGAALSVVIFTLLGQLVTVGPSSQRHLEQQLTFSRLSAQWRRDVHAASKFTWSAEDRVATLAFEPEHSAKYRLTPTAIERVELVGTSTPRRETYRIADADIVVDQSEREPSMATLLVPSVRTANVVDRSRRTAPFQASAVISRDHKPRG